MQIVGNQLWRLGLYVHHFLKSWIWSGNMGNLQKHNKNTIICPKCSFLLQIANISIFIGTMGSGIPDFQTNQAEEVGLRTVSSSGGNFHHPICNVDHFDPDPHWFGLVYVTMFVWKMGQPQNPMLYHFHSFSPWFIVISHHFYHEN